MGSIKGNILRIAASSDIVGNPYNFVNTLGSGVKKFYYEPRDGFMQGPIQGGIGVLKGTAGVVSSSAAAVTGVVGKLTSSVGRGVVMLTFDEYFIRNKEITDIKEAPTNTLDGIGKGLKSLGTSIGSGF
jgi:hypothetical protein